VLPRHRGVVDLQSCLLRAADDAGAGGKRPSPPAKAATNRNELQAGPTVAGGDGPAHLDHVAVPYAAGDELPVAGERRAAHEEVADLVEGFFTPSSTDAHNREIIISDYDEEPEMLESDIRQA